MPLFRDRAEWSDITPIPQDDPPNAICAIAYPEEYADAMGYFRAISARREYSDRVLELTETIISFNPAHYTIWKYRQEALVSLGKGLDSELAFVEALAEDNPKSYQIWHHRQVLIEHFNPASPASELAFIERLLSDDSKNYHAWTYRQWVVRTFALWGEELEFCEVMLQRDIRNNSAWNQRWFVMSAAPIGDATIVKSPTVLTEVEYTLSKLSQAPNNESAWNYLRGLIAKSKQPISSFSTVVEFAVGLETRGSTAPPLHSFLADLYDEQMKMGNQDARGKVENVLDNLAQRYDVVRANYWQFRKANIQS